MHLNIIFLGNRYAQQINSDYILYLRRLSLYVVAYGTEGTNFSLKKFNCLREEIKMNIDYVMYT